MEKAGTYHSSLKKLIKNSQKSKKKPTFATLIKSNDAKNKHKEWCSSG